MLDLSNTPLASRAWRLQHLYTILDAESQLRAFSPNLAQREFYNNLWYLNHVLKARKLGFSTLIELLNLDDALFLPNLTCGIVDKTMDDAKKKLRMVKLAYENLSNPELHPATWQIGQALRRTVKIVRSSAEILELSNGSVFYCGVSLRGGTTNRLHISELGYTAIHAPVRAEEIVNGAMNSFTPGNRCDIESTHEGGRIGTHYRLLRKCMALDPKSLTKIDFRFHFFAWWQDPRYVLHEDLPVRQEVVDYFARLSAETGREFSKAQMLWYDRKQSEQGHGMKKEFPSTPGEAFEAIADNAIYGRQMADLRAANRITDFGAEANLPLFTFWDLGLSDYTSLWLIQPVGRWFLVLDWAEFEGAPASAMPDHVRRWEAKWQRPIAMHFLPHDADKRSPNDGKSYAQTLREGGLVNLRIVPRTPDLWLGIGYVRDLLPHCWFHKSHCDTPRIHSGEEFPSGVACLEGYQKDPNPSGKTLREMPKHDEFSHSADAFRTFAEAWRRGMVEAAAGQPGTHSRPRAIRTRR